MEFVKVGKNYMIKNSNGKIVSKKEKELLENNKLALKEEHCKECEIKVKKNKKKKTATSIMEEADGINEETNTII